MISISGIDGAGKTSQMQLLQRYYAGQNLRTFNTVLGNSAPFYTSKDQIFDLAAMAIKSDIVFTRLYWPSEKTHQQQLKLKSTLFDEPSIKQLAHEVSYSAYNDALLWQEILVRPIIESGKTVFFDRYVYDEFAYRKLYGVKDDILANYYNNFPTPSLAVLLEADTNLAQRRNKDRPDASTQLFKSNEKLDKLVKIFSKLAQEHNLTKIKAINKPEYVHRKILELISSGN